MKYRISHTETGVLLRVWAPAPLSEDRTRPYLFLAQYRLSSEKEAMKLLRVYLNREQLAIATN
ncbi:MAG: hypothetical protein QNJ46_21000 [Leptolyngbyaceae cyanobacterium MO_188.B28]|nr:hypothetical protein [Leptolyngbyaceae cyanobacterium MO_188.B28]